MKLKKDDLRVERISKKYLGIIKDFKSYEKELADFLVEDAFENQRKGISVTYLWFLREKGVLVGYVTLLTDTIHLDEDLKRYFKGEEINYKSLPALKIGRLAVDDEHRQKGIGSHMIDFSIVVAKNIFENYAGCRFITVDAKRNSDSRLDSIHFYAKQGFRVLKEREKGTMPMYLDLWLKELQKTDG